MVIHYLEPEDDGIHGVGRLLSPAEVLEKLKGEFRFVKVNKARGEKHVAGRLGYLQSLKARGKNPYGEHMDKEIDRLTAIKDKTVHVTFYDVDPPGDACLGAYLLPGWPGIMFTYDSPEHYDAAQPLIKRCAAALKYDIREGG